MPEGQIADVQIVDIVQPQQIADACRDGMLVIRLQSSIQNDRYRIVRGVIIEFAWLQQRLTHIFKSVFRVAAGHEERGAMCRIQFARRRII